jgi:hypothetical protein
VFAEIYRQTIRKLLALVAGGHGARMLPNRNDKFSAFGPDDSAADYNLASDRIPAYMPEQSQLDKDIAALRSHVIDGIEELKSSTGDVNSELTQTNKILRRLFAVVSIIACLIAIHLIRHW